MRFGRNLTDADRMKILQKETKKYHKQNEKARLAELKRLGKIRKLKRETELLKAKAARKRAKVSLKRVSR